MRTIKKTNLFKIAVILLILLGGLTYCTKTGEELRCSCMDELYFYSEGEKEYITDIYRFSQDYLHVGFEQHVNDADIIRYIRKTGLFKPGISKFYRPKPTLHDPQEDEYKMLFVQTKKKKSCAELKEIIRTLENSPMVTFAHLSFCYINDCMDPVSFSHYFNVKVKDTDDLADLYAVAQETNTKVVRPPGSIYSQTFTLMANKYSKGNSLQMANYFYETGKFEWAYADMMYTTRLLD